VSHVCQTLPLVAKSRLAHRTAMLSILRLHFRSCHAKTGQTAIGDRFCHGMNGEEVIIAESGQSMVRLVPSTPTIHPALAVSGMARPMAPVVRSSKKLLTGVPPATVGWPP
jgi:hypothetical protein